MEIMVPVWPERTGAELAQSDLRGIKGVEVAFVDDYLDADFTDELEKQLSNEHGAIVKRFIKRAGNSPSPKPVIEEAAQCRVAIVGVAMCGSCTSATVFDAAALEKKGLHTVTIVWDTFQTAARAAARVHGVPDIKLAVVPSRQGRDTDEDQRAKARAAVPGIVQLLLAH